MKSLFSNKKYSVTIHARHIINSIFLSENPVFIAFFGVQNQSPITFGTVLVYNKILKVRNSTPNL